MPILFMLLQERPAVPKTTIMVAAPSDAGSKASELAPGTACLVRRLQIQAKEKTMTTSEKFTVSAARWLTRSSSSFTKVTSGGSGSCRKEGW
jgi:hypothetical protein